jgi:hypothetical protein
VSSTERQRAMDRLLHVGHVGWTGGPKERRRANWTRRAAGCRICAKPSVIHANRSGTEPGQRTKGGAVLYTLLIYGDPSAAPDYQSPEGQAEFQQWMAYDQAIRESGGYQAGQALQPAATATTVRNRNGDTLTTDGPFAETKEVLGGFYVIDVPDLDGALDWAGRMPNIGYGSVEVRPVQTFD